MKGLLDINIILDVLLAREPWVGEAQTLWGACDDGRLDGYVCASSLPTIFYIVRKTAGGEKALQAVKICLDAFQTCAVTSRTLELATKLPGPDFEDNVQIACALLDHLDVIISRDVRGYAHSTIPALSTADVLSRIG